MKVSVKRVSWDGCEITLGSWRFLLIQDVFCVLSHFIADSFLTIDFNSQVTTQVRI